MSFQMPTFFAVASVVPHQMRMPVIPAVPQNWQVGLPDAASTTMAQIADLHRLLFYVVAAAFVALMVSLFWVLVRYNRFVHPVARKTRYNPLLQAAWICFPGIVLVFIAIVSLKVLAFETTPPPSPDLVIEAVGRVGVWSYEYPDLGDVRFDSRILDRQTAKQYRQPYLLAADNPLVVPVGANVEIRLTSADLVHSWSVPALGVRIDAVPGRITRGWFRATKVGIYYGMCSEMCGVRKEYMPIAVKVVSPEEFQGWLRWAEGRFADAAAPDDTARLTMAEVVR